ncbi:MAG: pantetheine-phosphate adenylyltransferase [Candidatus Kariarchaeaceae archaeon]|jgi:pantetheine-phosphate adenylyltransferase
MSKPMKPYQKAVLGGTFDNFHEGHKSLISTACRVAEDAFIGVISDNFGKELFQKKIFKEKIQSLEIRIQSVKNFLHENKFRAEVGILNDAYGPSTSDPIADVIIVSYETRNTADRINSIRKEANLSILDIITIPWEFDENGSIISSSSIRKALFG